MRSRFALAIALWGSGSRFLEVFRINPHLHKNFIFCYYPLLNPANPAAKRAEGLVIGQDQRS